MRWYKSNVVKWCGALFLGASLGGVAGGRGWPRGPVENEDLVAKRLRIEDEEGGLRWELDGSRGGHLVWYTTVGGESRPGMTMGADVGGGPQLIFYGESGNPAIQVSVHGEPLRPTIVLSTGRGQRVLSLSVPDGNGAVANVLQADGEWRRVQLWR